MNYSKVRLRKITDMTNRMYDMEKLLEAEKDPLRKQHYINVMKQLQIQLEAI